MAFIYRRSDGSTVDPSRELADLVRTVLTLGPDASVSIMQMSCGCTVPDCSEVETQIMFARPDPEGQRGQWQRLRIAKSMRSVTAEDLRLAARSIPRMRAGFP
ncbi:hypothetical protein [Microvirga sp. VF16]|uniref:hypothetical protein n=1 Tax=Microvirga sp. VF16 TaxID=2807101 RepID=UPI00193D9462|nr:hypothetical protein [Microvirga sp. VF16]QRM33212.1 hypothetical protein JO965_28455 [Microvirga sp. VF16]